MEFLLGRSFSASSTRRNETEWPPHPSRLFSAMVAACNECELGSEARSALIWLEALEPPKIWATDIDNTASMRNMLTYFVSINDVPLDPERRKRQPRSFPSMAPESSKVWYIWKYTGEATAISEKLQLIAENVTYLGSSMSPVRVRISDRYPSPTIEPSSKGNLYLRVPSLGRLQHLEDVYNKRKNNTYIQPRLGRVVSYSQPMREKEHEISGGMKALSFFSLVSGNIQPEEMGLLSETLRKAIISIYPDPVPSIITGHNPDGFPVNNPHMSITPILDTGRRYSDGHIMGIAVWVPEFMQDFIIYELAATCTRIQELTMGMRGVIGLKTVRPSDEEYMPLALRRSTYSRSSRIWATVTPAIFGKHPKISTENEPDKVIYEMFNINGLPGPIEIRLGNSPLFRGSPNPKKMYIPSKFLGRFVSHVLVRFQEPVRGPVIIGSGRYLGYGLMVPFPAMEVRF